MNTNYQPAPASNNAITFTAVEETEKRSLSDAAKCSDRFIYMHRQPRTLLFLIIFWEGFTFH